MRWWKIWYQAPSTLVGARGVARCRPGRPGAAGSGENRPTPAMQGREEDPHVWLKLAGTGRIPTSPGEPAATGKTLPAHRVTNRAQTLPTVWTPARYKATLPLTAHNCVKNWCRLSSNELKLWDIRMREALKTLRCRRKMGQREKWQKGKTLGLTSQREQRCRALWTSRALTQDTALVWQRGGWRPLVSADNIKKCLQLESWSMCSSHR